MYLHLYFVGERKQNNNKMRISTLPLEKSQAVLTSLSKTLQDIDMTGFSLVGHLKSLVSFDGGWVVCYAGTGESTPIHQVVILHETTPWQHCFTYHVWKGKRRRIKKKKIEDEQKETMKLRDSTPLLAFRKCRCLQKKYSYFICISQIQMKTPPS